MRSETVERRQTGTENPGRLVVGSGWWCTDEADEIVNPKRKKIGSDVQREVAFFPIWLETVRQVCAPDDIAVVDSASPVKPDHGLRQNVVWIELPFNACHSTAHLGRWCGWTRSVLLSGSYALAVECSTFVYVEQDCLLKGPGLVKFCTDRMKTGLMFGDGAGTPQPIQQSFFIVDGVRLADFLKNLGDILPDDSELSPEWKFVCASWRPFVIAANWGLFRSKRFRKLAFRIAKRFCFDTLPVGSGRARPVPFESDYYYFQHGSVEDIERHLGGEVK